MNPVAKSLIVFGVVLIVVGLLWQFGGQYLKLGRLPGDIAVERPNMKFYFPVVTCLILSVVISLVLSIVRFFGQK